MGKYSIYKPSGVEWIGEIPEHWELSKFKYISEIVTGNTPSKTDGGEYYSEDGFLWIKPTYLKGGEYVNDSDEKLTELGKNQTRVIPKDSIMICCIGNTIGKYGISGKEVSTNQQINSIIPNQNKIKPWYCLFYVDVFTRDLLNRSNFVTLPILTKSDLENIEIIRPPIDEQLQIVQFLDEKTELIDKLISTKVRKITLLKEQRTSLINEVVTKGLNPNVKMKDSGVEWIGEIPENWGVFKMKYGVNHINDKGLTTKEDVKISPENVESMTGVCFNFYSEYEGEGMRFTKGDILLNKLRLYLKKIVFTEVNGYSMGEMIVLRCSQKLFNRYFYYLLFHQGLIDLLNSQSNGVKLPRVSPELIMNSLIPFPSLTEQYEIVENLDSLTKEIDNLVLLEQKKIDILKEYRQSLISEVVTGKIKVTQ